MQPEGPSSPGCGGGGHVAKYFHGSRSSISGSGSGESLLTNTSCGDVSLSGRKVPLGGGGGGSSGFLAFSIFATAGDFLKRSLAA